MTAGAERRAAEESRLGIVRQIGALDDLDTLAGESFDRITAIVCQHLNVPISLVSLVDRDQVWFKSNHGLEIDLDDRNPGLSASAILQDEPWVITDAASDPRAMDHPLVIGPVGVRFYLGVPLKLHDGYTVGALCAIDRKPRHASDAEIQLMIDLGSIVIDELELRLSAARLIAIEREARESAEISAAHFESVAQTLQLALESNRVIGQAVGLMMANYKTDGNSGFETLRKASQDSNLKLNELARQLVDYHNARAEHVPKSSIDRT